MVGTHGPQLIPGFAGTVVTPPDAGYDEARAIWNGQVSRRPAMIATCTSPEDVGAALAFARARGLAVSVRGGGHNVAGHSLADGGLVVDLSTMRSVRFDATRGELRAQGGALLGDINAELVYHGVITPSGIVTETGAGGLTLGGGIGWTMRRFGLACDHVTGVELVTAEGQVVTVDDDSDPDLMWGLRGAGANFGVVTEFRFRTHPFTPTVAAGFVLYHLEEGGEVLTGLAELTLEMPDEVTTITFLRIAPPAPWIPERLVGTPVVMVGAAYAGEPDEGMKALAPLRRLGRPLLDTIAPVPFIDHQAVMDTANPKGNRYYWTSAYLASMTEEVVKTAVEQAGRISSSRSHIVLFQLGGAVATPPVASCVPMRDAGFLLNYGSQWIDPEEDALHQDWTREARAEAASLGMGLGYTNFEAESGLAASHFPAETYRRLQRLKAIHDPQNTFRHNLNIPPSSTA